MSAPGETPATVVVVDDDGLEIVLCCGRGRGPDLELVDLLMRLALDARRRGHRLRLRDPSGELCALLELVGLADVLALEPRREPELGEQLGVEEVVEPGDPAG